MQPQAGHIRPVGNKSADRKRLRTDGNGDKGEAKEEKQESEEVTASIAAETGSDFDDVAAAQEESLASSQTVDYGSDKVPDSTVGKEDVKWWDEDEADVNKEDGQRKVECKSAAIEHATTTPEKSTTQ